MADPPQLGEYQLLERLGAGGMGTVYKALHTKLGREVAIKVLLKGRLEDENAVARFEREMKAIGALDHPNVVRATDAREVAGTRFLVMELLDGLDLEQIVRRCGPLPVADACEIVRQASLGLQCAHEHQLVHRDIKPSNLMLTSSGQVKILDLGLARTGLAQAPGEDLTATGQAVGTIDYMAPEQIAEKATVDVRTDIYSLGCTLYKLLTAGAPFSGRGCRTVFEKMQAHLKKAPPQIRAVRQEVPPPLAVIVYRMMEKSPDARFATPGQVADAIGPLAGGSDLVGLLSRAMARPVAPPTQEQARTEGLLPSSMTRMFQQFKLARRRGPAKRAAAGSAWRRWAPLLGCALLAAVLLPIAAVRIWPGPSGKGAPTEVAQRPVPAKPPRSYLILDCPAADLDGAILLVDGARPAGLGEGKSGQFKVELKPGSHKLEINRLGYEPIRRNVSIEEGTNFAFQPVWTPLAKPEPKPESKPEPKPEPKPDPKPEPKP